MLYPFKLYLLNFWNISWRKLNIVILFHRGNTEPGDTEQGNLPCCLPERKGSQFQSGGLGLPGSQVSQQGLLLKQVEVGHELQLGTGTGCFQLEAWTPVSQSGGSHGNGNTISFFETSNLTIWGWVNCYFKNLLYFSTFMSQIGNIRDDLVCRHLIEFQMVYHMVIQP